MTKTVALLELAERCENATGPDHLALERDIALSLGWRHLRNKGPMQDEEPYHWVAPDGSCHDGFPYYLTSLDAALQLVPERSWTVGMNVLDRSADATICLKGSDHWADKHGHAETPALALCAASLRALASQGNNNV